MLVFPIKRFWTLNSNDRDSFKYRGKFRSLEDLPLLLRVVKLKILILRYIKNVDKEQVVFYELLVDTYDFIDYTVIKYLCSLND